METAGWTWCHVAVRRLRASTGQAAQRIEESRLTPETPTENSRFLMTLMGGSFSLWHPSHRETAASWSRMRMVGKVGTSKVLW